MADKKKKTLFNKLSGLWSKDAIEVQTIESNNQGVLELSTALASLGQHLDFIESEVNNDLIKVLPASRHEQYKEFDRMEEDPICGQALQIHTSNALTYDEEAGHSVYIESKSNENDPVVKDLKDTFHEWQQHESKKILYQVAKYGAWGVRPYFTKGNDGIDLTKTLTGPECHPDSFKMYEALGQFVGVWSKHQDPLKLQTLGQPWQFIVFKAPGASLKSGYTPRRINPLDQGYQFDIWDDEPPPTLTETMDYGQSLYRKAYKPWKTLEEAYLALLIARLKCAQRETLIGYPVSNQDPIESAKMVRELTDTLQARDDSDNKRSLKEGLVKVARKLVLPYDGTGKGQITFSQAEPNINIDGIADVMMWVKILCGSLGVEPSLVGFSDLLSGGLGEGGFLRNSILSAAYGIALRQSLRNGFEYLYDIHVKLKWGKIYTPNNKPWRTKFHAVSDAKQREFNESRLGNIDFAERFVNLVLTMKGDPEAPGSAFDNSTRNIIFSNLLKFEEPLVRELTHLNGKPDDKTAETGDRFAKDKLSKEEKVDFIEEQVNQFLLRAS
jgi:hypothetical protein